MDWEEIKQEKNASDCFDDPVYYCSICGECINDFYYDIDGLKFCDECINECKHYVW